MIKKEEKNKICIIILLIIIVLGMAVVYATLSQTLNITGTARIASDWNIEITDITRTSGIGATDVTNSPNYTATIATFNVDLSSPGSTATYKVIIENKGQISAKLSSIKGITTANEAEPVELQFSTNANVNDTLAPGATVEYNVIVTWDSASQELPTIKTKTATIEFEYLQNT